MNKVNIIGIGFRPLDKNARKLLLNSEVVLSNGRLLEAFKNYDEYEEVKDKIITLEDIHGTDNSLFRKLKSVEDKPDVEYFVFNFF